MPTPRFTGWEDFTGPQAASVTREIIHVPGEIITVKKGERIGPVSDNMGDSQTTIHLHYDMYSGGLHIPPYASLVEAYKNLIDQ